MADLLVMGIILLIVGAAAAYIWKAKKRGVKCIGCPSGSVPDKKDIQSAIVNAIVQKNRRFQGKPVPWKRCGLFI